MCIRDSDGGDWSDGSHWALSSGGSGSGCAPTFQDNVYFDANSFSSSGQTVSVSASLADCKSMDWTGVTNDPTFDISNDLNVYGSLTFSLDMTVTSTSNSNLNFKSTQTGNTVTFAENSWGGYIYFNGVGGEWGLQDSLSLSNPYRAMYVDEGVLNTNGNSIRSGSFYVRNTATANMSSSNIYSYWAVQILSLIHI